jgi:Ca2+-binding EF-hand superfamily protein
MEQGEISMRCSLLAVIVFMAAGSFAAQEDQKADGGIDCSCEIKAVDFQDPAEHQAAMLKEFDKDKDGKLSDAERDEAQMSALKHKVEQCQAMRDSFDKDNDGKLSAAEEAEFDKAVAAKEEKLSGLLTKFDADKDGKLNAEERKNAIETGMAQRLENWLEKFDKDKSGNLNAEESQAMLTDIRSSLEQKREMMWKQFDSDKDGMLNDMERGNALKALGDAFQKRHQEKLAKYDMDKDGKLSAEEQKAIQAAAIFCSCSAGDDSKKAALRADDLSSDKAIDTSADKSKSMDATDDAR